MPRISLRLLPCAVLAFGATQLSSASTDNTAASTPNRPVAVASAAEDSATTVKAISALLLEFLTRVDEPAMHARFWADDLVYTSGKAEVKSKAAILASFSAAEKDPAAPRARYEAEDVNVRAYGDTAALTFRLVAHLPDGTTAHYRNSGTFLRRGGIWQVVTWQATPEPAPAPAKSP